MAILGNGVSMSSEWFTPQYVFEAMGVRFDLDAAHPGGGKAEWVPADEYLTEGSLERDWGNKFIWLNPPFGKRNSIATWLEKLVKHGNGVVLTPDRTSAPWWQQYAAKMDCILFVAGKIEFIDQDGNPGKSPAQGTTLMAMGGKGCLALQNASRNGLGLLMKKLDV